MTNKLTKSPGLSRLLRIIDLQIEINPVVKYGLQWCGLPQAELAERAQISVRSVQRLGKSEPIQHHICELEGVRVVLYRRADGQISDELDTIIAARTMAKEWKQVTGRKPSPREFGCLVGLAEHWPPHSRLKIFRYSLRHWTEYMSGIKTMMGLDPDNRPDDPPEWIDKTNAEGKKRYWKHPCLTVMRRAWYVGPELFEIYLQETGKMGPGEGSAIGLQ